MIDGCDAVTACYRFAGALNWRVGDLIGASLRDLWQLRCGHMESIRRQVLYQAAVIFPERPFDTQRFIRTGQMASVNRGSAEMTDENSEKVAFFQGCMNRGLPDPDFNDPNWREVLAEKFADYDAKHGAVTDGGTS